MTGHHSLAGAAALIGEPTRAAMLLALLDGRALPAGDLARAAHLSAPATSLHLAKLTQGGLLSVRREGRHRYYRLASADVVHALEALGVLSTAPPPPRSRNAPPELREARTCYDHLAGALAVRLAQKLERGRLLRVEDDHRYSMTAAGERWFAESLGIEVATLAQGRRPLARRCLDWTERRPHLAGVLGAAVLERLTERRWIAQKAGSRAVRVTARGEAALEALLS